MSQTSVVDKTIKEELITLFEMIFIASGLEAQLY